MSCEEQTEEVVEAGSLFLRFVCLWVTLKLTLMNRDNRYHGASAKWNVKSRIPEHNKKLWSNKQELEQARLPDEQHQQLQDISTNIQDLQLYHWNCDDDAAHPIKYVFR